MYFPAGLNDCSSALQWMFDNKEKLGVSKIIVSNCESGGGNLTLATTLKAKKDEKLSKLMEFMHNVPTFLTNITNLLII